MMFGFEKLGGRSHPRSLPEGFRKVVTDCGLVELGFSGSEFIYEKSRGTEAWVQERLDRGLPIMDGRICFRVQRLRSLTYPHQTIYL